MCRDPQCKEYTGAFIMDSLGLPSGGIWKHVLLLCAFPIFYQGSAIAIFRVKPAGRLWYVAGAENEVSEACPRQKPSVSYPTQSHHSYIQFHELELYKIFADMDTA